MKIQISVTFAKCCVCLFLLAFFLGSGQPSFAQIEHPITFTSSPQSSARVPTLPQFKLPYASTEQVYWTGGPHVYSELANPPLTYPSGTGSGMDFSNGTSFEVLAMASGTVIQKGWGTFGQQVAIKHDIGGTVLIYGHLSEIYTLPTHVDQSTPIGKAGNTGRSGMKIHLHIELRDGSSNCALHCLPNQFAGNPIGWDDLVQLVDGWYIGGYLADSEGINSRNYDGSAVRGTNVKMLYNFHYNDNGTMTTTIARVHPDFSCKYPNDANNDCEIPANHNNPVYIDPNGQWSSGPGTQFARDDGKGAAFPASPTRQATAPNSTPMNYAGYLISTNTPPASPTLNFTVKLENPQSISNFNHSSDVAIVALQPGTNNIKFGPRIVRTDTNGNYNSSLRLDGLKSGTYDICAKAKSYLGQCARNVNVSANSSLFIDFWGGGRGAWLGDIDPYGGDNEVNTIDWEVMKAEWRINSGHTCPPCRFDVNQDGSFDSQDASLVMFRVNMRGEGYFGRLSTAAPVLSAPQSASPTAGSRVYMQPEFVTAFIGNTFNEDIYIDTSGSPTTGADVKLYYDPGLLEVIDQNSTQAGVQISSAGLFSTVFRNTVDTTNGIVWFSAAYNSGNNSQFNGIGRLAAVSFRVKAGADFVMLGHSTRVVPVVNTGESTDSNAPQYDSALDILQAGSPAYITLNDWPLRTAPTVSVTPVSGSLISLNTIAATAQVSDPTNQVQCVKFSVVPSSGFGVDVSDCDGSDGWSAAIDVSSIQDQVVQLWATAQLRVTPSEYTVRNTNITLDRTGPSVWIVGFNPYNIVAGDNVRVYISASDGGYYIRSYVQLWVNTATDGSEGGTWVLVDANYLDPPNPTYPSLGWDTRTFASGTHLLAVSTNDTAGNYGSWTMQKAIRSSNNSKLFLPLVTNGQTSTSSCIDTRLTASQTVAGNLGDTTSIVNYCYQVTSSHWGTIRMFQYQNTNLDTFLQVFDPSGYLVKWNDDAPGISRNSYLTYQFSQTGNYRIQATRFGSSYGAYRLRLEVGRGAAAGDVDMNCIVDTDDYNIIYQSFNGVLSDPRADVNLNGYFDSSDLDIWRSNNGTTCASGASTLQPQNKK